MNFILFSLGIIAGSVICVMTGIDTSDQAFDSTCFGLITAGLYHCWLRVTIPEHLVDAGEIGVSGAA